MTAQEGKQLLMAMALEGLTAVEARKCLPNVPRATFYRWAKGIDWRKHQRPPDVIEKHAARVRQSLIRQGRVILVDVGDGPQTLREVSLQHGIPYGTLYYRYQNKKPLLQEA